MKTLIPIICPSIVDPVDWLFSNLATLLASHSKLRSLDIKTRFWYAKSFDSVGSLHQLFPSLSTRPRLLHLGFDSCPILFDEVTLHSLIYLTSFKLLHTRYKNLDASSPSDIWKAFVASGIHLTRHYHQFSARLPAYLFWSEEVVFDVPRVRRADFGSDIYSVLHGCSP